MCMYESACLYASLLCPYAPHPQSTSLITPAPLWSEKAPSVINYIPKCSEENYSHRVKCELGFEFPPVMGKCVEQLVQEVWTKIKDKRYAFLMITLLYF